MKFVVFMKENARDPNFCIQIFHFNLCQVTRVSSHLILVYSHFLAPKYQSNKSFFLVFLFGDYLNFLIELVFDSSVPGLPFKLL